MALSQALNRFNRVPQRGLELWVAFKIKLQVAQCVLKHHGLNRGARRELVAWVHARVCVNFADQIRDFDVFHAQTIAENKMCATLFFHAKLQKKFTKIFTLFHNSS